MWTEVVVQVRDSESHNSGQRCLLRRVGGNRSWADERRRASAQLFSRVDEMDYHDLRMLELERVAEERLKNALLAVRSGEVVAKREVQRLTIMLDNIRQMKNAAARMRSSHHSGSTHI
jgi:hypothetical protein